MKKLYILQSLLLLLLLSCASTTFSQREFRFADELELSRLDAVLWKTRISVINMIPNENSNETEQDSEPNIAVNPANTSRIVGSAFTPNPTGDLDLAPVFISSDGGTTWALNNIVPSGNGMTGDISLKFGTKGSHLYTGILLGGSGLTMNILRSDDPFGTDEMELLVSRGAGAGDDDLDQPYINTITSGGFLVDEVVFADRVLPDHIRSAILWPSFLFGRDRVFVGNNDFNNGTQTANVDHSASARSGAAPAGFTADQIEDRTTNGQDRPSVRCSASSDGTVYALFARTTASSGNNRTCDVTVVRDDNFATGVSPFTSLTGGDGNSGVLVATGVNMPFINSSLGIGNHRLGSHMSICVNPIESDEVYIAWTDRSGSSGTELHVRRSGDRGATWSTDRLTITNGLNPTLAVNSLGVVGVLYHQLTGTSPDQRWETHLRRSGNSGSTWSDVILATTPSNNPTPDFQPYLGDYCDLMTVGKNFYGVFSASNIPDLDNFPQGVTFQRNADFTTNELRNVTNTGNVNVSIDPFFFKVEYGLIQSLCDICPDCCRFAELERNKLILECAKGDFCHIRDKIPKNCLVKFECPGCERTALCPPYYHIFLEDFDPEMWRIDLRTGDDQPVPYELNEIDRGVVISFRPDEKRFREMEIGDYDLVFDATAKVKPGVKYPIRTHLEVSDYRWTQHQRYAGKK